MSAERIANWPCSIVSEAITKPAGPDAAYMPRLETVRLTCKCGFSVEAYADQAWAVARDHMRDGNAHAT